jgi:hypothetical protein
LPPITAPRIPIDAAETAGAQSAIGNATNKLPYAEAEKDSGDQAEIHTGPARENADKARDEGLSPKTNIDKAAAEERPRVDAVFAQLDADKTAAEAEGHAMELVAYGGIISLLVLIIVVAPTRIQKTQTARPRRRPNSLKRHHLY